MAVREDRRVQYTKMVLQQSFIKLLSEKDISKIAIKEICEGANINRATFYAHYSDQYDLLHKIEDGLFENIASHLHGRAFDAGDAGTVDMVEQILEYIKKNALLCKILISERGDLDFQKRIMMLVYDKDIDEQVSRGVITREDAEYIYSFKITGCVGVIQKWMDSDMKTSTRSLSELLLKLAAPLSMT
ncbi:TetR-like C-terminal domain-containing protein [Oscillospiraceae bacterium WX1]